MPQRLANSKFPLLRVVNNYRLSFINCKNAAPLLQGVASISEWVVGPKRPKTGLLPLVEGGPALRSHLPSRRRAIFGISYTGSRNTKRAVNGHTAARTIKRQQNLRGCKLWKRRRLRWQGKRLRRFPLSHRYGCGWLSKITVRRMEAGQFFDRWRVAMGKKYRSHADRLYLF
jgi:hypothetical protein